jgi:hypothetical protein
MQLPYMFWFLGPSSRAEMKFLAWTFKILSENLKITLYIFLLSIGFSVYLILPAALWLRGRLSL